ncbi:MAG: acyl-CoA dehydrogenase family protein [Rhodobacterales bacterium]|nr:acyl-CoA dehydrogenase family protein [Rhodobacterales bacterium]
MTPDPYTPPFVADHPPHPDFNAMADADFRALVRTFVETHYPDIPRYAQRRLFWPEVKPWYAVLARAGWIAPTWPVARGGMGLGAGKHLILIEEYERFGCARVHDIGVVMLGPLLMQYGTPEQQDHYLPRILSGEDVWAQGYSEPGAGSDLAAVATTAELDGDTWVINGQKTWVTLGIDANRVFVLARTDKTVKKQAGISFLLVPMDAPGVTARPIENLERNAEFCEIFFDNVRIPAGDIVGEVNQGWTIAKALLGHERVFIGAPRLSANALARLEALARRNGLWDDPAFRDRFAALAMDLGDLNDLFETYVQRLRKGEPIGADVGVLKIFQSELYQRISEELMQVAGSLAGVRQEDAGDRRHDAAGTYLAARPTTIFAGSTEILRNVLARGSLDLPK